MADCTTTSDEVEVVISYEEDSDYEEDRKYDDSPNERDSA
jgi:hypothetical protein